MKLNLVPTLMLIALGIAFLMMLYIFYLLFEPYTPPILTPSIIPILNHDKTIRNGETVSTKINYCVYKKVHSITTRRIESINTDRRVYYLSTTVSDGAKPGCASVTSNYLPISADIPPGKYKLIMATTFKVNALKEVPVVYETEPFTVRPKDSKWSKMSYPQFQWIEGG